MSNPTPEIIDLVVKATHPQDGQYIVSPRTSCYALAFMNVTDIAVRFRFRQGTPWVTAAAGDYFDFACLPIQTGIEFDLATPTGPAPAVIVMVATQPGQLSIF